MRKSPSKMVKYGTIAAGNLLLEGVCIVKTCICCGKEKSLDDFYVHPQMGDGHLNKCKVCVREYASSRRVEHPEKIMLTRVATCEKNPTKLNAYRAVEAAIMCGAIVKPERCSKCGGADMSKKRRVHAHHHDYTHPLAVEWLCPKCHAAAHPEKWTKIECPECGRYIVHTKMDLHRRAFHV